MREGRDGPERRHRSAAENPPLDHLVALLGAPAEKARAHEGQHRDGQDPANQAALFLRDFLQGGEVRHRVSDLPEDAFHVPRAHHGQHPLPFCIEDLAGHVGVPLVDEHPLDGGGLPGDLFHGLGESVLRLELLDVLLPDLLHAEDGRQRRKEELVLFPEGERVPRPFERDLHGAVHRGERDPRPVRLLNGRPHLLPGLDPELVSHAPLD